MPATTDPRQLLADKLNRLEAELQQMRATNSVFLRSHADELRPLNAYQREQRVPFGGLLILDEISRLRGKLVELDAPAPVYGARLPAPTAAAAPVALVAPTLTRTAAPLSLTQVAPRARTAKAKPAKRRRCRGTCKLGICTCGRKR